jgi:hypothetical protein
MSDQVLAIIEPQPAQLEAVASPAQHHFTLQEMAQMSHAFAKSGMFGLHSPEQALSLLLIAQAEGIHPAKAMMEYHVIENKPSLKADAMLARHQRSGGKVKWICRTDTKVTALFIGPLGEVEITWDQARATKAGLWGKANFQKHPAQMLSARCISEGVRAVNPAAIQGFYAPEEVMFFEDKQPTSAQEAKPEPPAEPTPPVKPQAAPTAKAQEHGNVVAGAKPSSGTGARSGVNTHASASPATPAAPALHPDDVQPPLPAPAPAPAPPVHKLPVGVLFTATLSQGQYIEKQGAKPYYAWLAFDPASGERDYVYCWHKTQPCDATQSDHPETYRGSVQLKLSEQFKSAVNPQTQLTEKRAYYRVEEIAMTEVAS